VLKLSAGSVVELDRQPEEPVDVIVNGYVIARGEVVVVDGNYAVRVQEIVSRQQRLDASGHTCPER
jgi:flagellar motor switch protein FliN/FliY